MRIRTGVVAGVLVIAAGAAVALGLRDGSPAAAPASSPDGTMSIAGGPFEPSGAAHVPGTNLVLFVDDGRPREIFLLELAADGKQVGSAVPIALGADVTDLEGITSDGRYFYVVGSQSKKTGFDGDGLLRFTFDTATRRIENVERIQQLKAWLADNVAELAGTAGRTGDDVLNIEGVAWDPHNNRLLLGLRAPQANGDALVIPIRIAEAGQPFARENLRLDGTAIRLALGGAGVRGIEYDATSKAFHVIAGAGLNEENRDFQMFEWSGQASTPLRSVGSFASSLKPEGFTRAVLGSRQIGVIVFDVGRFAAAAPAAAPVTR